MTVTLQNDRNIFQRIFLNANDSSQNGISLKTVPNAPDENM